MAQTFNNPYPYFNLNPDFSGLSASYKFNPDFLKQYQGKFVGMDTGTGQRGVDLALSNLKALYSQPTAEKAGLTGSFEPSPQYKTLEIDTTPSTPTPFEPPVPEIPDTQLTVDQAAQYYRALEGERLRSDLQQNIMNIPFAGIYSKMSLDAARQLRQKDYELGLAADINSPTRQAQRNQILQGQATSAAASYNDSLRALAEVRRAAGEAFRLPGYRSMA